MGPGRVRGQPDRPRGRRPGFPLPRGGDRAGGPGLGLRPADRLPGRRDPLGVDRPGPFGQMPFQFSEFGDTPAGIARRRRPVPAHEPVQRPTEPVVHHGPADPAQLAGGADQNAAEVAVEQEARARLQPDPARDGGAHGVRHRALPVDPGGERPPPLVDLEGAAVDQRRPAARHDRVRGPLRVRVRRGGGGLGLRPALRVRRHLVSPSVSRSVGPSVAQSVSSRPSRKIGIPFSSSSRSRQRSWAFWRSAAVAELLATSRSIC